jgi:hypothetical protein
MQVPEEQTPRSVAGIQLRITPVGHLYEDQHNSLLAAVFGLGEPRNSVLGRQTAHTTINLERCLNTRVCIEVQVSLNGDLCNGGAFAMSERARQKLGNHETHRDVGKAERGSESF